ncbi:MAG TPA: bifunctional [glutamate--ammonia ligase]-adenylyl-L-tyrosine phosphorylase/[glutamate--ammonia-ligase] adenylyltransferase [Candidatus Polarisedimenticolia bacterium]|nr:bifunctional [glutamate--ammonia ligase]-adenylyl-L-tyrosine phosphorylase/[glutamate--ammonia-ligase] adenylyltransferase [Candidatus Polarisedimenticolia bacterium]
MSRPALDPLYDFCLKTLEDPERGLADIRRVATGEHARQIEALLVRLLADLPDPDLALMHLERFSRDGSPPSDPESFQTLLWILGFSPYLAESLINDRQYLEDLVRLRRQEAGGLGASRDQTASPAVDGAGGDPWRSLRIHRRRETLRIALKDLQRVSKLPEVCTEISVLADSLIRAALRLVDDDLTAQFGQPLSLDESGLSRPAVLAILSLGKLGGTELNYSSDVDLLFIYSGDGETTGLQGRPETQITNKEFFTLAAERLARGLSTIGPEGQVFRVDCRLRPGGRDGDLVMLKSAAEVYYRTWARPWERQALIKARPTAGDLAFGHQFLEELQPVLFPSRPDPALIDDIRTMKDRIDADLARRREGAWNIKLGRGGIREVEFIVQALQLLHGGAEPWIHEPNTLRALHRLTDKGFLSVPDYGVLTAAYTFLREVEHRIQLPRNLQRSVLPGDPHGRRVLARSMGYRDGAARQEADSFLEDLENHREGVRGLYDAVFGRLSQARLEEAPAPDPFLDPMSDVETTAALTEAGIADSFAMLGGVKAIRRLMAPPAGSPSERREFRRLTPVLLAELARVHTPVRAVRHLERFLASLRLDRGQVSALLSRRELIPPLIRLFAGSQPLSSILIHRPRLVLERGMTGALARDRSVKEHVQRLSEAMGEMTEMETVASLLRGYQRTQILYIGLKDLNRQAGPAQVARVLSDLAEAIIAVSVGACARAVGWPVEQDGTTPGFLVLGLGKLGYRELDYFSDLDLIFLYDATDREPASTHAAANHLAGLIMQMLTSITREGALYPVDARLRPFGPEGELAQPVSRLQEYFLGTADVWEMQSFLKARPISGDLSFGLATTAATESLILKRARSLDVAGPVREMKLRLERDAASRSPGRTNIKLGPGGLSSIQFAIQLLQLKHAVASPPHKKTTRLLSTLRAAGLLDEEAYRILFTGFQFLRRLEHQMRLGHGRAISILPASKETLDELAADLGFPAQEMIEQLEWHRRRIETTFDRLIEAASEPEPAGA